MIVTFSVELFLWTCAKNF